MYITYVENSQFGKNVKHKISLIHVRWKYFVAFLIYVYCYLKMTQKEMRSLSGRFQSSPQKQRSGGRDSSWHRDMSVDREEPTQKALSADSKDKMDGRNNDVPCVCITSGCVCITSGCIRV